MIQFTEDKDPLVICKAAPIQSRTALAESNSVTRVDTDIPAQVDEIIDENA